MISAILANYNGSTYLAEAIKSVLAQEYDDFEFIIVDDGSTDESRQIIAGFKNNYPDKIKAIFLEQNQGQGEAFNVGVRASKGDLIAFLDSDDIWYPEKLAGVQQRFSDMGRVAFFQHNLNILRDNQITPEHFRDILAVGDYFGYTKRKRVLPQFIATSGLTFSRPALEKVLPIPSEFRTCADGFLTRTCFCYGEVDATNICWGAYRVHAENNTFENPNFSNRKYCSHLLIPSLNRFYRTHGIDFAFHDRISQLGLTLRNLRLPENARILMLRCAAIDVIEDVLEVLFGVYPDATVDLLAQASASSHFSHLNIRILEIKEGFFDSTSISPELSKKIQDTEYTVGLIPYSVNNPMSYQNVHAAIAGLHDCPFVGITYDGDPIDIAISHQGQRV